MKELLLDAEVMPEPQLEFTGGQLVDHPATGLTLFGPVESHGIEKPDRINYAIIGTEHGTNSLHTFLEKIRGPISPPKEKSSDLWPHFPGFEEATHTELPNSPISSEVISEDQLDVAVREMDDHKRVYTVVEIYLNALKALAQSDSRIDLAICVVPEIVYRNCRPKSKVRDGYGGRITSKEVRLRRQTGDLFDAYDPEQYEYSLDFRRQIKARAMAYKIPIQIIRETSLRITDENSLGERRLTFLSDRAWNLSTAMLYKSGRKPWKLSGVREGVCYIGIAFKRTDEVGNTACSAAQMFLNDGDGIVFLGDSGKWYSPKTKQCHLSKEAAQKLLKGVLETYQMQHGKQLKEVFLHSRSSIEPEEWEGYKSACPEGIKLVCVRVAQDKGFRAYRNGDYPVVRGTFLKVTDRMGFLWGNGFKPLLRTYDGFDVPEPLRIEIQYGDAEIRTVAKDILGLTKLNYNTCKLGESRPVTIHFSDAVGEILVANKATKDFLPNFKYYV
ncbi:MAG: hypothetical protein AB3N14_01635 [Flavobacteriaceae bacterium]